MIRERGAYSAGASHDSANGVFDFILIEIRGPGTFDDFTRVSRI